MITGRVNPGDDQEAAAAQGEKTPDARETAWASPVGKLRVTNLPAGALNLNVEGREIMGPLQGFGQLWQKTYWIRLSGSQATAAEVIRTWKTNFPKYWPAGNRFYGPIGPITPGDVAVLNLTGPGGRKAPGGMPLISTGVLVIYADDESFAFMTPEGHMFAAMITFSAFAQDEVTVAQIQALVRANDPLYELAFRLGFGHKAEDQFWQQTLQSLAADFGVKGIAQQKVTLVDPRVQWAYTKNIWKNAAIRTAIYMPVRLVKKLAGR
ncbi:MAG TPA: hypothetical protein VJ436_01360 [Anaerolineales bacterium]|nr:hypothetical protein [Anaerolineales bacterium]